MTRDAVIRMAREAGDDVEHTLPSDLDFLECFASLVAAAEREACAVICDAEGREWDSDGVVTEKNYAAHCAAAIRARGGEREAALMAKLEAAEKERDAAELMSLALRAKIAGMEKQEPVAVVDDDHNADGLSARISEYLPAGMMLYALPGAKGEEK